MSWLGIILIVIVVLVLIYVFVGRSGRRRM